MKTLRKVKEKSGEYARFFQTLALLFVTWPLEMYDQYRTRKNRRK